MAELYITSQELIKTLRISSQELINTEKFFDSVPDDEWELIEGKDYRVVIQSSGLREYTAAGAYTIARYLEANRKSGLWGLIKEWFLHTKQDIRRAFIKKKVLDNCSSLIKRNNLFFISQSDLVVIFGTKLHYLNKMAEHTQGTQYALIQGQDYDVFADDGRRYYSLEGIYKLSLAFNECQSKRNRKEWCKEVGEVVEPQVQDIVSQIEKREKSIQKSMDNAKRRDRKTCQVTEQKPNKVDNFKLAAHHLYSRNEYPHLADVENNLITLSCDVHERFHQTHMGGYNKPCTIDDFINFVEKYYPTNTKLVIWLKDQKLKLGNQQPEDGRKPHVLYLPFNRVS
ncbi:MAG: hypothetical protein HC780_00970 [Leptolyngbyaceae cyanobacterium CSU_1_3]|nr:hypothetical protein [Leptolyngbyaceae cyanobacterium CSU_1_3]